jgi:sporulation protein YlmC with PRC-barrel domain
MSTSIASCHTVLGAKVYNQEGETIGRIEDIMISTETNRISYYVLSYGGIFGTSLGDKRFAVPENALMAQPEGDAIGYRVNVSKDFLENAPGFDKDNPPDFASSVFQSSISGYYTHLKDAA